MSRLDEVDAARGDEAARLLEQPLLVEAFAVLKTEIDGAWREAPARDVEGRERLWLMRKLVDRVEEHLVAVVETGRMARAKLAQLEEDKKLRNLFGLLG